MPSKKDPKTFPKQNTKTLAQVMAEEEAAKKAAEAKAAAENKANQATDKPKKDGKARGRVGRKPKDPAEKESEMVGLMLTPAEKAKLQEKAGLVKLGTFLKHHLRTETDLLK